MPKSCSKCDLVKGDSEFAKMSRVKSGLSSWCKSCISEHNSLESSKVKSRARASGPKGRFDKWTRAEKRSAQIKAQCAVYSGKRPKAPCIICNNPQSQGHHENYDKPLDVV